MDLFSNRGESFGFVSLVDENPRQFSPMSRARWELIKNKQASSHRSTDPPKVNKGELTIETTMVLREKDVVG
jgi:hypothetical protein